MTQRALITGISGFLGGFLAEYLLECGDAVLGMNVDGRWEDASPAGVQATVELLPWDISRDDGLSADVWRRIVDFQPTCVYHLAGISVPADCGVDEPTPKGMAVNLEGTRRALDQLATLARRPRFLFVSSSHVYAPGVLGDPPLTEDYAATARSPYGITKLLAEAVVCNAIRVHGFDALVARSFQHVGPRQSPRLMLAEWAAQFAAGRNPVEVRTRGAVVDIIDVRDGVRAYRRLMERGQTGQTYNVGSGIARTSGEILDLLCRIADPSRTIVETRPGPRHDPVADISRLVADTGWQAMFSLEQTVADTWQWWQRQRQI